MIEARAAIRRRPALRHGACIGLATLAGVAPCTAGAGFGAYLPGLGARSNGAGGIVYSLVQDTTPLSSNPALARIMGTRGDASLAWFQSRGNTYIRDNLLGPDDKFNVVDGDYFFPYAGFTLSLNDRLSFGMTGFLAGLGAVYDESPLRRFGGDDAASLSALQAGVSTLIAYEILPNHNLGISFNLSYDGIEVEGLGDTLARFSESPEHFTDQGLDGVVGLGYSIGWYAQLRPWLAGGAAYRSKTYTQGKIDRYKGLLPDQGNLQFPAFYGAGLALTPAPGWTFALEAQRVEYSKVLAFSSPLSQFPQQRFGADHGPGFGWHSQNVYRGAVQYAPSRALELRAGYAYGTQPIPRSETLFTSLAPDTNRRFYSLGGTWYRDRGWEWTAALGYEPTSTLRGKDSLPLIAGGGEIDVDNSFVSITVSVSRQFDYQWRDSD